MTTPESDLAMAASPAVLSNINYDDPQDKDIIQVCADRLKGNGAWNGQGLLVFLASTSRKDKERVWMEPLRDLCEKVVYAAEDGESMPTLSDEERGQIDALLDYSKAFHAALQG